ncbi:hypothetical protein ACLOJK_013041 [Asimina triloba]
MGISLSSFGNGDEAASTDLRVEAMTSYCRWISTCIQLFRRTCTEYRQQVIAYRGEAGLSASIPPCFEEHRMKRMEFRLLLCPMLTHFTPVQLTLEAGKAERERERESICEFSDLWEEPWGLDLFLRCWPRISMFLRGMHFYPQLPAISLPLSRPELPFVTLVYPLYASVKAIESKSRTDDQQWLTYWVLYSLITLFELTFAKVIELFPFWPYAKLAATCWLVLPYFNGAAYVYQHYVRPCFQNAQTVNIWYLPRKKDIFSKQDDILVAAEKYIAENGTEAFENLIKARSSQHHPHFCTDRAKKSRRKNGYMIFDEDENNYTIDDSVNYFQEPYHQTPEG